MKKMLRCAAGLAVLTFVFLYGFAAGKYGFFPGSKLSGMIESASGKPLRPAYFQHKKSFFEDHGQRHDIVFVGDSITDNAEWEELFPAADIADRGVQSDRTEMVLERMDSILSTKATKAFVMIGFNDIHQGYSVEGVFVNYKKIINGLRDAGMDVYVQSTLLAGTRHQSLNQKIKNLNVRLVEYSKADNGVHFLDLNESMAPDGVLPQEVSVDGVHLNGAGYAAWKEVVATYVSGDALGDDASPIDLKSSPERSGSDVEQPNDDTAQSTEARD